MPSLRDSFLRLLDYVPKPIQPRVRDLLSAVYFKDETVTSATGVTVPIKNADVDPAAAIAWTKISKTGAVASDVGADVSGAAATVQGNLTAHAGLTTTAHGGIVASTDARLTDARTPLAHALIDTTGHTASGLTTGNFLKATGATTYGFAAHGLTYSDVGADPAGAAAAITLAGLGGVPTSRKINGYDLTADRTLSYSDVGADAAGAAAAITLAGLGGVPTTRKITSVLDLSVDRNLTYSDVGADASGAAATVQGNLTTHAGLTTAHGSTNLNTASTIVQRDASGNFSAGTITANLTGNASGTAANVTGVVAVANGGTGLSTLTAGYIPFGNGTSALGSDAALTWDNANKKLIVGGPMAFAASPGNPARGFISVYNDGNAHIDAANGASTLVFSGWGFLNVGAAISSSGTISANTFLIGPISYATSSNLLTTSQIGLNSWAWNGSNGYTIHSTGSVSLTQLDYTSTHARMDVSLNTNTKVMSLSYTGTVGIGTTNAAAKLAVNGGVHVGGDSDPGDNNLLVDGTGVITGGFGCNGKTAQTAYASGGAAGAVSGTATSGGYGFVSAAEFNAAMTAINAIVTLANNHRTALVNNGIES